MAMRMRMRRSGRGGGMERNAGTGAFWNTFHAQLKMHQGARRETKHSGTFETAPKERWEFCSTFAQAR